MEEGFLSKPRRNDRLRSMGENVLFGWSKDYMKGNNMISCSWGTIGGARYARRGVWNLFWSHV